MIMVLMMMMRFIVLLDCVLLELQDHHVNHRHRNHHNLNLHPDHGLRHQDQPSIFSFFWRQEERELMVHEEVADGKYHVA